MSDRGRSLAIFLSTESEGVKRRWREAVLSLYNPESLKFLGNVKDLISNPVGHAIDEMVREVIKGLSSLPAGTGLEVSAFRASLFPVVQARAVQGLGPSASLRFAQDFKHAVRSVLEEEGSKKALKAQGIDPAQVSVEAEAVADALMALALDAYVECRERLHEVKLEEIKSNMHMLLRRANLVEVRQEREE